MGAPFSPVSLQWSRVCCPWAPGLGPHLCLWKNWQDAAVSAGSKGSLLAEGIPPVTAPLGAKRMAKSLSSQFPLVIFQRLSQKEVLLPDFFPFLCPPSGPSLSQDPVSEPQEAIPGFTRKGDGELPPSDGSPFKTTILFPVLTWVCNSVEVPPRQRWRYIGINAEGDTQGWQELRRKKF